MKRIENLNKFLLTLCCLFVFSLASNAQIEDIQVGTSTRKMLVYAPPSIVPDRPLLLSLHGLNQDINYQQGQTQWETVAKANNFVVVYPGGINNSWDLYGTSDTDFMLAIIDEMYERYGIDRDRVYMSGFSMGGMMTYHAATKIADKIAAFAPVSGYLMGGPNTNSSRPIPIIHTHGTADDVVPFGGVQTCLDAWIARNNCPETAVVTKPYPADKPSSNGTKYYWGKGTDNVEVVLMRIEGTGHWHSNNSAGIHTSQEIWDFCKNYSLAWGIPEVELVSVTESNPTQIKVDFNLPLKELDEYSGFKVEVDNQIVEVSSSVLADSSQLLLNLSDSIVNDNEVVLSYNDGNVVSVFEKPLAAFDSIWVENLLYGASPRIIEIATNENGDALSVAFNMKMQLPTNTALFTFTAEYDSTLSIPVQQCTYLNNDSSTLIFPLAVQVFADYKLNLSYADSQIVSVDNGILQPFSNYKVTNNSKGLPVDVISGWLETDGVTLVLDFTKPMALTDEQLKQFVVDVNGTNVLFADYSIYNNSLKLKVSDNFHYGDSITVSYVPGDVTATDKGRLNGFTISIENRLSEPVWHEIPGKIEAEKYSLQSGTDLESTSDTGGGQNVGWIETGDWMEYAIENNSTDTDFEINFRIASPNNGGRISIMIDGKRIKQLAVPNTGNWQTWKTVSTLLSLEPGKHYIKIVAANGGYNVNYFSIEIPTESGVNGLNNSSFSVFPNPVKDRLNLKSFDFQFNEIEIMDLAGNTVFHESIGSAEIQLSPNIPDGIYIVKVSNGSKSLLTKFVKRNN